MHHLLLLLLLESSLVDHNSSSVLHSHHHALLLLQHVRIGAVDVVITHPTVVAHTGHHAWSGGVQLEGESDCLQLVSVLAVAADIPDVAHTVANLHAPRLLGVLRGLWNDISLGDHQVVVQFLVDQQTLVDDVKPVGGRLFLR